MSKHSVQDFERWGNRLFRWRSYVPLAMIGVLFIALTSFRYPYASHVLDTIWDMLCLCISLFGLAVRIAAVGFVKRGTSGRNTKGQLAEELNTTGMYSLLRHPLYFGNFWMWLGVALFPRVWWCAVIIMTFFIFVYERIIFAEEAFLSRKFGTEYEAWAARTPLIWPRFRNWIPPRYPFSIKSVLRRENSSQFGMMVVFFLLETVGTYVAEGEWEVDVLWAVLFGSSLAIYVVLKVLKKAKYLSAASR